MLPDAFHALRIHALSPFFHQLRQVVSAGAPSNDGAPHIVVLTPGPYTETYFEHAYLARQLGFPLVEGGDLTVRDDRVYLKTVSGLRPVHAILRRLDDDYCDPLEMRSDSTLGIPGLVQAWRAGHVLVANAFGMSVLESPALLAFLPPICERLFGETLETPAIATWWCGETAALDDARRRLAEGVIKPAFADASMEPVFLSDLDRAGREWAERLGTTPDAYVVEEFLPLSHAPVWHDGRLESRALMLRVFLLADGRGDYRVMPGGLSRIAGEDRHVVSGQRGGSSKDTWVLSDVPVAPFAPIERRARPREARGEPQTSSRAAEHLFWLGRYAERSENGARLLRSVLGRLTDADGVPAGLHPAFLRACVRHDLLEQPSRVRTASAIGHDLIAGLVDRQGRRSLGFNVEQTVRVAGAVRDRLSTDNWRVLNRLLQLFTRDARARPGRRARADRRRAGLAGGGRRPRDGPHDPRRRLAVSQPWPSPRAPAFRLEHARRRRTGAGRGRIGAARVAARAVGQPADLPRPPHAAAGMGIGRRLDARRRAQPAIGQVPAGQARQARPAAARCRPDRRLLLADVERLLHDCRADTDSDQGELFDGGTRQLGALLTRCQRFSVRLGDALSLGYFSHVHDVPRATIGV